MGEELRVLIVEDSEDDTQLVLRELRRGGYDPVFERVETAESMSVALQKQEWDVIISDYLMPRFTGLAALKLTRDKGLDLPLIIVSGSIGEDIAVEAMRAGANDYVMKNNLRRFLPAVQRELSEAKVRHAHKQAGSVDGLFKTAELVKYSGLRREIIYEYITYGLIKEERKTEAGHRLFSEKTLRQVSLIRNLAGHGYSLRDIREIFVEGRARRAVESVGGIITETGIRGSKAVADVRDDRENEARM